MAGATCQVFIENLTHTTLACTFLYVSVISHYFAFFHMYIEHLLEKLRFFFRKRLIFSCYNVQFDDFPKLITDHLIIFQAVPKESYYFIILQMHKSTARNSTFANVKYARYLPLAPLSCLATYLNEIRLAMDAIRVPSPPRLVPTIRSVYLSVNPDSSTAAGTLLMTWLARTEVIISCPPSTFSTNVLKPPILPMFPINTKNPTNVNISE